MRKCRSAIGISACCVILLSTLTGCGIDGSLIKRADIVREATKLTDSAIVWDAPTDAGTTYRADAEDLRILQTMDLTLENEQLQFYVGKFYDVAVVDKATGSVFFSNEAAYYEEEGWSEQRVATSRSQVSIEYYGASNSYFAETSYPHCLDNDGNYQIKVETAGSQTTVTYQFGEPIDSKIFCRAMTKEAFEGLEELAQPFLEDGTLTSFEWRKFKSFYNYINYDELNSSDKEKYEESQPKIVTLKEIYVLQRGVSETQRTQISRISQMLGIDEAFIKEQTDTIGFVNNDENVTAFFEIPVVYELHGRDLVVRVNCQAIRDTEDFKLTKIHLLTGFGATPQDEDGYIFLPDGSGVIAENTVHNEYFSKYEFPFYGSDYGVDILEAADIQPDSLFPVFGIRNGNRSVFAIVESGDAMGGVSAQIGNDDLSYNTASPWFTYYAQDRLYLNGLTSKDNASYSFVYPETPNTDECRVRYHFLYGESATYSGMARYYQKYLLQTEALVQKTVNDALSLDLNFVGSIRKKKTVLGVPVDGSAAASTFTDIAAFTKQLSGSGAKGYHVILEGALNGGMEHTVANSADLESVMGSLEAYTALKDSVQSTHGTLSFSVDFFRVRKSGNGLVAKDHLTKYLTKQYAYTSDYAPPEYLKTTENQVYLTAPLFYPTLARNFLTAYAKLDCQNLHLTSGGMLYGDYSGTDPITRSDSKAVISQVLQQVKAGQYTLSTTTGNVYTLRYVDRLTDVPTGTSDNVLGSYAVPFAAMVLHGYVDYTGSQLNQQGNYQKALLENIRSGAGLNFLLMTDDPLLLEDTKYSNLFSVHAGTWSDEIVSIYTSLNKEFSELQACTIVDDQPLASNVYRTTYSNGKSVIVNFNANAVETAYGTVDGMGYLFVD